MYVWIDEWMHEWMDGWVDGRMNGCIDGWMYYGVYRSNHISGKNEGNILFALKGET